MPAMSAPGDSSPALLQTAASAAPEHPQRLADAFSISIVLEDGNWSGFASPETAIQEAAAALIHHLACRLARPADAMIVLGSDALVQDLNRRYRGKDTPTNVLSFPFQKPPGAAADEGCLGDVVLAAETILREAEELGITPVAHLQHLVVHGLLHLLGYDHTTDAQAAEMEGLETQILAGLGIADPYAAAAV